MRVGILAVGVLILIIGFASFFYGYSIMQKYQQYSTILDLYMLFQSLTGNTQLETTIKMAYLSELVGGILCIVGFFVAIVGLVAKPKEKKQPPP
jgi:heme A synthase